MTIPRATTADGVGTSWTDDDLPAGYSWMRQAACTGADLDVFFPDTAGQGARTDAAIALCRRCPVTAECLEYALVWKIGDGVYGGRTERQRREPSSNTG